MMPSTSQDEIPPPPPPPPSSSQTPAQPTPHTVSTIKLPILKKGEDYDFWGAYEDGALFGSYRLSNLGDDRSQEMWDAIKSRFGGNDESKKMQKYILKQQFEGFSVSNTEGLHKGYDRFQSLLSQLEIHGAGVSNEDANQKFLRSLPSAWSQVSLIMRTKPGVDTLSFDDLFLNWICGLEKIDVNDLKNGLEVGQLWPCISMSMKKVYKKTWLEATHLMQKRGEEKLWNFGETKDGTEMDKRRISRLGDRLMEKVWIGQTIQKMKIML
ncbi:hypothetical protein Tco_0231263 [Tanacetum coccineum]